MNRSRSYFARRILYALIAVLAVACFNFFLFRILPGNPSRLLIPRESYNLASVRQFTQAFHLNLPLYSQFLHYLIDTPRLQLGLSFNERRPVTEVIAGRIWPTLLLAGVGEVLAISIGSALGVVAGWRRGRPVDAVATTLSMTLYAMPTFWVGLNLIVIFAVMLRWLPVGGMAEVGAHYTNWVAHAWDILRHLFLPLVTWTLVYTGYYYLLVRTSVIAVARDDYVLTARAKGLSESRVVVRHVARNALLPTATAVMLNLGFVIAGSILIETVFDWPGMGLLTYQSIDARDYPVMQGIFLFSAVAVIGFNLVADLMYYYLDPRVKA